MTTTYNPYDERRISLEQLGFSSYEEYLESRLWHAVRLRALAAQPFCECSARSNAVHHADYELATMKGERPEALVACCKRCHGKAERVGRKIKDPRDRLQQVTALLLTGFSRPARRHARQARREKKRTASEQVWGNSATWSWARPLGSALVGQKRQRVTPALVLRPDPKPRLVKAPEPDR